MTPFFLMHFLYLAGGLVSFMIQYFDATKVRKTSWSHYDAFKAAMASFFSWVYVLAYMITRFSEKVMIRLSTFEKHL